MVPSSAKHTDPSSVYRPPTTHTVTIAGGVASWPATRPGVRRMPIPSVLPTMTARPNPRPRMRRRLPGKGYGLLRLERDQEDVHRRSEVPRTGTGRAAFALDIHTFPAIPRRRAVRRVFDGAAGQMDDERIRAVRVKALPGIDFHPGPH